LLEMTTHKSPGLSPAQMALLEQRLKGQPVRASSVRTIPRRTVAASAPLSFIQEETLRVTQTHAVPPSYLGTVLHYSGVLDLQALQQSVAEVSRRHESLRTSFATTNGVTVQVINPPSSANLTVVDLSDVVASQRLSEVQQLAVQALERPFDLAQSPLWRVTVFRLGPEEYVLAIALDHLIADFLSLGILVQELGALHEAFAHRQPSPLPELQIQYGDWAAWQRERVRQGELEAQFSYWRERLQGYPPALELPFALVRPAAPTFHGALRSKLLPYTLSEALRELSRKYRVSLYVSLLAAFSLLVRHYTGRDNFVLGRGVAGRTSLETEKLIGCFINMVLLRLDLSGNPPFMELLKRVQAVVDGAYANQDLPFVKLAESLQPASEPRRPPLAQIFFNLYTAPSANKIEGAQLEIFDLGEHRPEDDVALFQDMILGMQDSGNRLIAELKYNRELFEVSAMEQLLEHYQTILQTIVAAPAQPIQELIGQTSIPRPQPAS
jgi:hypothetical protein